MIEIDEETRDFLTINKRDFGEKEIGRSKKFITPPNYTSPYNIINGPYRKHLHHPTDNRNFSDEKETEDVSPYLRKIRQRYIHLENVLPKEISYKDIIKHEEKSLKSVYQLDYSKDLDDHPLNEGNQINKNAHQVSLPDNWPIPETIYSKSYRYVRRQEIFGNQVIHNREVGKSGNLMPNLKQRELLHVKLVFCFASRSENCSTPQIYIHVPHLERATRNMRVLSELPVINYSKKNAANNSNGMEIDPYPKNDSGNCKYKIPAL